MNFMGYTIRHCDEKQQEENLVLNLSDLIEEHV